MKEAVIVSTARTGLTKSYRGSFNNLEAPSLVAPVIRAVLERAGVEPGEVEDVIMGAALQQGTQGTHLERAAGSAPTQGKRHRSVGQWSISSGGP